MPLDGLLPAAREHGQGHLAIIGAMPGAVVVAVRPWLSGRARGGAESIPAPAPPSMPAGYGGA